MRSSHLSGAAAVLLLAAMASASASTITIGAGSGSNAFPFDNNSYAGEYQQVYNGSLFAGPADITGIAFFQPFAGASGINGAYTLSLSTTSASVAGPSTVYANNPGADNTQFFSGAVSNVFSFNGGPFLFDPSQGNLLLDVFVTTPGSGGDGLLAGCSADTNRVYNFGGDGAPSVGLTTCPGATYGLQTQFTFAAAATAVPEPLTLSLFGAGLAGIAGLAAWRRHRNGKK